MSKTYRKDPKLVTCMVGPAKIEGFNSDRIAEVLTNAESFTYQSGSQGDVIFEADPDKTGVVRLHLHEKSPSNRVLQAVSDKQNDGGEGDINDLIGSFTNSDSPNFFVPIAISDNQGDTFIMGKDAVVSKLPDLTFGRKSEVVIWEFLCAELTYKF